MVYMYTFETSTVSATGVQRLSRGGAYSFFGLTGVVLIQGQLLN